MAVSTPIKHLIGKIGVITTEERTLSARETDANENDDNFCVSHASNVSEHCRGRELSESRNKAKEDYCHTTTK